MNSHVSSKLIWACRRGMLELDVLLGNFLHEQYLYLSSEEQALFRQLLDNNDQDLFTWLTGRETLSLKLTKLWKKYVIMQTLDIRLKPSKFHWIFYGMLMATSVTIVFFALAISGGAKLGLTSLILSYTALIFIQSKPLTVILHNDSGWEIELAKQRYLVELKGDSTFTRFVSVLRFKSVNAGKIYSCLIWRDALSDAQYRQLLITAKFSRD